MPYQLTVQRNLIYFNVKDYGAQGDGVTNDTTAIQAAINAAVGGITNGTNTAGGTVLFPAGTYIHTGLTLYSYVHLRGTGYSSTVLQLKNGANADCIQGYNAISLIGGSSSGGIANFGLYDLTIDGNKSNQTGTSYGLRWYGYGYTLQNIRVRNTYSDALRSDWNGGATVSGSNTDQMEAVIMNCKFHDTGTGAIGVNFTGPHDSLFTNVISFKTGSHCFYLGPNVGGTQCLNCHGWGSALDVGAVSWLIEGLVTCVNCEGEGSDEVQVVMLANNSTWASGRIFSGGITVDGAANNTSGVQIGQQASLTLKSAATTSPITLTNIPTTVSLLGCFLQFVITGASTSGTISVSGTNYQDSAANDTLNPTGNGTYVTTNSYESVSSITWTGLTGASINVVGLGVPFPGSSFQSGGNATTVSVTGCKIDSEFGNCEGANGTVWFSNDGGKNNISGNVVLSGSNSSLTSVGAMGNSSQVYLVPVGIASDGSAGKGGRYQVSIDALKAFIIKNPTSGNDLFNYNTNASRSEWVNGAAVRLYSDNYTTRTVEISNGTISVFQSTTSPDPGNSGTITTSGVGIARVTPTSNETSVNLQAGTLGGQQIIIFNESSSNTIALTGSNIAAGSQLTLAARAKAVFYWDSSLSLWF